MRKILFFYLFLFVSLFADAQDIKKSEFNLPPGCVLKQKNEIYDLSYKLEGKSSTNKFTESDLQLLKDIPLSEIENYKEIDPEYYNYYMKGMLFFEGLSLSVRQTYTLTELWYIYVFDQNLKNKLLTIK